jgi:lipoprotein Spr
MRAFIFFLSMLLLAFLQPGRMSAQSCPPKKASVKDYFGNYQLVPDSACSPYLYYKVYEWAGTRYRYAGKTKKGIDCSGFVRRLYEDAYCITLSGGSKDIWPLVQPVDKECLAEGDILFFKIRRGQISHVGVYLGNNKFAHASVHSGVVISDLDEDYYKKYFYKGGRLLTAADH